MGAGVWRQVSQARVKFTAQRCVFPCCVGAYGGRDRIMLQQHAYVTWQVNLYVYDSIDGLQPRECAAAFFQLGRGLEHLVCCGFVSGLQRW